LQRLLAFVCILWSFAASTARASDPPKILLMQSPNAQSQLALRLHAEFTNLGIAVVEVPDDAGADAARSLNDAATREHAFAAIRVVTDAGGVTVWVADRLTDKILVRSLPASRADVGGEVVALEVVELLRASLLELNLPAPSRQPSPPEVAALIRPAEAAPPPSRPSRFRAELAPMILAAHGLTKREGEVAQLALRGKTNKHIARSLRISEHTVEDHFKSIFTKVGVSTRGELAAVVFAQHYH